jgi:lipopolysaccharide transport system permease protein
MLLVPLTRTPIAHQTLMDDAAPLRPSGRLEIPAYLPRTRRAPAHGWHWPKLRELWDYRELIYFFAWRDIKVRYRQTVMGALWAIIQPLLTMVIFSLFFGRLARVPSDDLPYPLFSYAALVPWTFFANALSQASNSLVVSTNMIKKIYFPRLALPIATVLAGTVDFVLAFVVLLGLMLYYGLVPTANVVWLPLFLLLALVTTLGVSLWLSAMNVLFRDVRYTVTFLTQAWLFVTPIAYPSSLLSEPWRTVYGPMTVVSFIMAASLLVSGALYFRRMEQSFADVL